MLTVIDQTWQTPLVKLTNRYAPQVEVYAKIEYLSYSGSIKGRPAKFMLKRAIEEQRLTRGQTILECSGGNTALGLAMVARRIGFSCEFVVPKSYSSHRLMLLEAYKAKVTKVESADPGAHYNHACALASKNQQYYFVDQVNNPDNVLCHYLETGPEIARQLNGDVVDYFVAGIGSGGTISGIGRRLLECNKNTKIVGVAPEGCDPLAGKAIPHKFLGFSLGLIPKILDASLISEVVQISLQDARSAFSEAIENDGIFVGPTGAANISACMKIAARLTRKARILTVIPDHGSIYLPQHPLMEEL